MKSDISGFYKLSPEERREILRKEAGLSKEETDKLEEFGALKEEGSNDMAENVVSNFPLPLGIATNLKVNGKDYLVPMATEEASVVAACSYGAKLARKGDGVSAEASESLMIGQIQLKGVKDFEKIKKEIKKNSERIISLGNDRDSKIIELGGGVKEMELKCFEEENMAVLDLIIDVKDSMGANTVNSICEDVAPLVKDITGADVGLRILSNLADRRTVRAEVEVPFSALEKGGISGEEVAEAVVDAYRFARVDPYRAATHNKGIMNGMDAVCIATGNDFRALEAGVHSYASKGGKYGPVTEWWTKEGKLKGRIEVPVAVGTVGGITSIHPTARICHRILGVESAKELEKVIAAVGLVQNLAALRALATEGIQKGHMKLHAKNLAKQAGAKGEEVEEVAKRMVEGGNISQSRAGEILEELRKS